MDGERDDGNSTSYSVLAGPPDAPFLADVVRHHRRSFGDVFAERVLVVDDLRRGEADGGPTERLLAAGRALVAEGAVDRLVSLRAFHDEAHDALRGHFGRVPRWERDFRGIPVAGWAAGLAASAARWHLHCDSDVLICQPPGTDWLEAARRALEAEPRALVAAPHPGPPGADAHAEQSEAFGTDAGGNLLFAAFSSRRFFTERRRFARILPLGTPWVPSKRIVLRHLLRGKSPLLTWELMVDARQRAAGMQRLHTPAEGAWTLHCPDHGPHFVEALPEIIRRVEAGEVPSGQVGSYDLRLECWT